MNQILTWGMENYASIIAFLGTLLSVVLFFRKWIINGVRSIHIGTRFHSVFGSKPVEAIKAMHEKLREENNKLSIRLDIHERYLSIGLFICEPQEGKCIWTNEFLNNLFGIDSSSMKNFGWMGAVDPADRQRTFDTWMYSIEYNVPYECTYRIMNQRTKATTTVVAHSIAAMDENNEVVCYVGYITECK